MLREAGVHSDMGALCELFGKSRQAYYQRVKYNYKEVVKEEIILQMISKERKKMPRIGGRKLLLKIQPVLPDADAGADACYSPDTLGRLGW